MTDKVAIRQFLTGVPGLDQILGGGLPEFSFNLIAGAPGAGKTTLAQQLMFALAGPDRSAVYFTVVGEPPLKMLRYQQQFSFFDVARVNESVRYVNLSQEMVNGTLDKLLERITEEVEAASPGVVSTKVGTSEWMRSTQSYRVPSTTFVLPYVPSMRVPIP